MDNCLICGTVPATQKNSHIIPSFLLAPIFSYDGSGKREKEVMFSISPLEKTVYIGELPDTKLETLFDLEQPDYDNRTITEFRNNTASKDYIFCPKCESLLSKYLESPYSNVNKNGECSAEISFFFWLSVIWRISISGILGEKLDTQIEDNLGRCLKRFFEAKENGDTDEKNRTIINDSAFTYRLMHCPQYINKNHGFVFARYDNDNKIFTVIIGEFVLFASFAGKNIPKMYSLWGIERQIDKTHLNNGLKKETIDKITPDFLKSVYKSAYLEFAKKIIDMEKELINICWNAVGQSGQIPEEIFKDYLKNLYSEEEKIGDRITNQHRFDVLKKTLQLFGLEH